MRSYAQFCAAARALDVIGERWSMLIVRELLLSDCRFTDLRRGLPGIATNLLTDRLRALEDAGVLERHDAPPPVATTLYRLTARGRALEPVLRELIRWGMPEMLRGLQDGDVALGHWAVAAVPLMYEEADLDDLAPLRVAVEAGGDRLTLHIREGALSVDATSTEPADVSVRGATDTVLLALAGQTDRLSELDITGDRDRLEELLTRATTRRAAMDAT